MIVIAQFNGDISKIRDFGNNIIPADAIADATNKDLVGDLGGDFDYTTYFPDLKIYEHMNKGWYAWDDEWNFNTRLCPYVEHTRELVVGEWNVRCYAVAEVKKWEE